MSEDRLERALQEMREEDVDAGTLEAARARVWENDDERRQRHLCGVPAGLPGVSGAMSWAAAAASWSKTISAAAPAVAPGSPR